LLLPRLVPSLRISDDATGLLLLDTHRDQRLLVSERGRGEEVREDEFCVALVEHDVLLGER
jgi:hypothetical protein